MSLRAALVTSMLLLAVSWAAAKPSCVQIWIFKVPCAQQLSALLDQVIAWSSETCEEMDERCMYQLVEYTPTSLAVNHVSLNSSITTAISFNSSSSTRSPSSCKIKATSIRNDPEEAGPNEYCLIYDLVKASGVTSGTGAREICNEGMCPSLASAPCKM